jgi:hypothetical protein
MSKVEGDGDTARQSRHQDETLSVLCSLSGFKTEHTEPLGDWRVEVFLTSEGAETLHRAKNLRSKRKEVKSISTKGTRRPDS